METRGSRAGTVMGLVLPQVLLFMAGGAQAFLPAPPVHAPARAASLRQGLFPMHQLSSVRRLGDVRATGGQGGVCAGRRLDGTATRRSRSHGPFMSLLASGGQGARPLLLAQASTAAASAHVAPVGLQLLITKLMGYGILAGSFGLQVPQIFKIVASKSVIGISRTSRYSEVPINSSTCIYHILKKLPFSTWGENAVVLFQNLLIVALVWFFNEGERVTKREMFGVTACFVALCAIQFSLPSFLHPLLIYINVPLGVASNLPQIITNFRQKHTGQVATLSNFLKFLGCSIRIFTTLSLIGIDWGLLVNYGIGATMNIIIVAQGFLYSEETKRVLALEKEKRALAEGQAQQGEDAKTPEAVAGSGA